MILDMGIFFCVGMRIPLLCLYDRIRRRTNRNCCDQPSRFGSFLSGAIITQISYKIITKARENPVFFGTIEKGRCKTALKARAICPLAGMKKPSALPFPPPMVLGFGVFGGMAQPGLFKQDRAVRKI